MTMLRVTVDTGDESAVVTYTAEYGWIVSGSQAIVDMISVEEIEPRKPQVVEVPVISMPMLQEARASVALDGETHVVEDVPMKLGCAACGCLESAHNTAEGKCSRHQCSAWVQDF
jgi:hypothetical protein